MSGKFPKEQHKNGVLRGLWHRPLEATHLHHLHGSDYLGMQHLVEDGTKS